MKIDWVLWDARHVRFFRAQREPHEFQAKRVGNIMGKTYQKYKHARNRKLLQKSSFWDLLRPLLDPVYAWVGAAPRDVLLEVPRLVLVVLQLWA